MIYTAPTSIIERVHMKSTVVVRAQAFIDYQISDTWGGFEFSTKDDCFIVRREDGCTNHLLLKWLDDSVDADCVFISSAFVRGDIYFDFDITPEDGALIIRRSFLCLNKKCTYNLFLDWSDCFDYPF